MIAASHYITLAETVSNGEIRDKTILDEFLQDGQCLHLMSWSLISGILLINSLFFLVEITPLSKKSETP